MVVINTGDCVNTTQYNTYNGLQYWKEWTEVYCLSAIGSQSRLAEGEVNRPGE